MLRSPPGRVTTALLGGDACRRAGGSALQAGVRRQASSRVVIQAIRTARRARVIPWGMEVQSSLRRSQQRRPLVVTFNASYASKWNESRCPRLIISIRRVSIYRYGFAQSCRSGNYKYKKNKSKSGPMNPLIRRRGPEQVEHGPHAHFTYITGVTTVFEESARDKRLGHGLGSLELTLLVLLKRPDPFVIYRFYHQKDQKEHNGNNINII